jgi:hypothetical protein
VKWNNFVISHDVDFGCTGQRSEIPQVPSAWWWACLHSGGPFVTFQRLVGHCCIVKRWDPWRPRVNLLKETLCNSSSDLFTLQPWMDANGWRHTEAVGFWFHLDGRQNSFALYNYSLWYWRFDTCQSISLIPLFRWQFNHSGGYWKSEWVPLSFFFNQKIPIYWQTSEHSLWHQVQSPV